jgi:hypothetical protein
MTTHEQFLDIERRLADGHARMQKFETDLAANTRVTMESAELTRELHSYFMTGKRAVSAINWIGGALSKFVGWCAKAAGWGVAIYGAWYAMTHSGPPR